MDNLNRVLNVLKRRKGGATKAQIFSQTGYWNVGDAVMKLRRKGHTILTEMKKGDNRRGEPVRYAVYHYVSK
jgi:hypothetical protein